jgi:hypothetical protein
MNNEAGAAPSTQNPFPQIPIQVARTQEVEAAELVHGQGPEHAELVLNLKKRNHARHPSMAWRHFTKKKDAAFCNFCFTSFNSNSSSHQTNNMLKHMMICPKR